MPVRRLLVAVLMACGCIFSCAFPAFALGVAVAPSQGQVWVQGRQIAFAHLAVAYGDPVAPADDPGLTAMLAAVAARSSWQPGTRFVAIARADGKLVTFAVGSNAVSVDGVPTAMPFAPFTEGSRLYLPLLPLARALGLGVRGFRGGYVFVPQLLTIVPRHEYKRIVVRIAGSAPLTWRAGFSGSASARTLTLSFPGFGTDAVGTQPIGSSLATTAAVSESGPPGFPTTSVAIEVARGARFVTRRVGAGNVVDVLIARSETALRAARPRATPPSVRVVVAPLITPTPKPATPAPTEAPSVEPSTSPAPEPTDVATAEPLGPGPSPSSSTSTSPTPSAPPLAPSLEPQKIINVSVAETATGTRVTLTLTGPVAFEWHRLIDPDNRYWLDIDRATLIGPAQTFSSRLAFIKDIKVSQHALEPDQVVRVSIDPTQAIDVRVGTIAGAPNQLGIDIESQPPAPDAAMSGSGDTLAAFASAPSPSPVVARTQQNLIVIDPGHGGTDPGSMNPGYGLTESKMTLNIAHHLAADLKRQGWQVELTRDGDYDVGDPNGSDAQELQARCDVANAAGARLFVSVHINSSVSSAPNGATTYYWRPSDQRFAQAVENGMVAAMGITNDGVIRNNFYVIHHTVMPSILVEAGYLSNPHDATLLAQQAFLDKIAAGIAQGIGDFTGGPSTPVGQTRAPHNPPAN